MLCIDLPPSMSQATSHIEQAINTPSASQSPIIIPMSNLTSAVNTAVDIKVSRKSCQSE